MIDPVLVLSIRVGLAALLLAAAWHKLRDFPGFSKAVAAYRLVPPSCTGLAAALLVGVESALSLFLLLHFRPAIGLAATLLFFTYALAIAINLRRGRADIDCGCVGPAGAQTGLSWTLVLRNACLAALALLPALPVADRALSWLDVAVVAATVVCAGLIYLAADLSIRHGERARRFYLLREDR